MEASRESYEHQSFWDEGFYFVSTMTVDPDILLNTISDADYLVNFTYTPTEDYQH